MKVSKLIGAEDFSEKEQPVPDFCLSECGIGLEYEWENTAKFPTEEMVAAGQVDSALAKEVLKYFDFHVDGSLRGEGKEFTFKGPYAGSKILRATRAMDECSRAFGFTGSYRTSLHCHLNMQDTNFPEDVERLGAIYCLVEPYLYQFVGSNRNTSNYCIPWYKHPQHFENFLDTIKRYYRKDDIRVVSHFRAHKGDKYAGLNCFSIGGLGTVEFRHAPVTMQRDKIHTWLNLIMRLKEWTMSTTKTPTQVLDYANRYGSRTVISEVFKGHYGEVVRLSRNIETDFWNGLETLYQYTACC